MDLKSASVKHPQKFYPLSIIDILMEQRITQVLDHKRIVHIIERMAWQIYEHHYQVDEIYLMGIKPRGNLLSRLLEEFIQKISSITIHHYEIELDKDQPHVSDPVLTPALKDISNKHIVVVDDVLNTGSTLLYALKPLLKYRPASLSTAVLVDRNHKSFPVHCDVTGIQLSTSLQEHVFVDLSSHPFKVYLK